MGLINPEGVAQHLSKIAKQWCVSLRYLKGDSNCLEKFQAYKGLCYTISRNSDAIKQEFAYFCSAVAYYKDPKPELYAIFKEILHTFKLVAGSENWKTYIYQFPEDLKHILMHKYEL